MKNLLSYLLVLIAGILIGGSCVWISSYSDLTKEKETPIKLENILESSYIQIQESHFSCESDIQKTVGSVIASIYEMNNRNIRNRVSLSCFDQTCSLSISGCKPWQSQECGSRHLKFEIDKNNKIDPLSFMCIDVP